MNTSLDLDLKIANPSEDQSFDVIIIGGGPAGATAAIYTARVGIRTLVLDKGLTAGALGITGKIANYPGIAEDISGVELLERMRAQARSFGAIFSADKVIGADLLTYEKTIFGNAGNYNGRVVIIATGSMGRGHRVKGEDALLGRGVSYCATCDGAFFRGKEVAVAGNSDEAIEEALFLTRFVSKVHFFSPTQDLKAPVDLIEALTAHPGVTLYRGTGLREVIGTDHVEAVRVALRSGGEQVIPVSAAFIYLQGGKPITDFLQGQLDISETGCLVVDREFKTTLPDVYAIGDVLCNHVKQAVVAASEGAVAGIAVEKILHGRKQLKVDWSK